MSKFRIRIGAEVLRPLARIAAALALASLSHICQAETPRWIMEEFLAPQPNASAPPTLKPRNLFPKPTREDLVRRQHDDVAIIKFTEGTGVRLRDGLFEAVAAEFELDRAQRAGVTLKNVFSLLARVNEILCRTPANISRLLGTSESALRAQRRIGEITSGRELPDLNLFYELRFPGKSVSSVVDLVDELNQLELVEYVAPTVKLAAPPADFPPTTPDFSYLQGYHGPAPAGIDVAYARLLPGGRGEGLRVVDVEQGWITDHEDYPPFVSVSGVNFTGSNRDHHGAAVVGEIAAAENTYGMTGIAPAVEVSMSSPVVTPNNSFNLPDGIQRAINQSRSGDIILVEQQVYYNWPADDSLCPPEWDLGVFSVVETAVATGRIVVETAGNGAQDLDDTTRFGTRFDRSMTDSGAILVGAGSSVDRSPLYYSNYGFRLDLQGWGENIATLGYADIPFPPNSDPQQSYTQMFGGTSGAAPIVAGAAALLQTVRRARGYPDLTAPQMRAELQVGATPQGSGVNIGPLPDLRDAIEAHPLMPPVISAAGSAIGSATVSWAPVAGASGYEVFRRDTHTGAWFPLGTTFATSYIDGGLSSTRTHAYHVRAYDAAGSRSAESNYDIVTTIDLSDPSITTSSIIRAIHIIDLRRAVNSICLYAGTSICATPPFTGNALDELQLTTQVVKASDFNTIRTFIQSLRDAVGASPAALGEIPSVGMPIRAAHLLELRVAAN